MAKLSYGARTAMPKKSFAIPSRKTASNPAGKGGYPIPDASHARNALARVSQFGSPAEKAQVRAKVHKAYPGISTAKNPPLWNKGIDPDLQKYNQPPWEEPVKGPDGSFAKGVGDLINQSALQRVPGPAAAPDSGERPSQFPVKEQASAPADADFHNKGGSQFTKGTDRNLRTGGLV